MSRSFSSRLEALPPSGIRRFFDLVIGAKDIISLGVGEPDFLTPWPVRQTAIECLEAGRTSYTSNLGLGECRTAITDYISDRFAASYDPETECLVTNGVSEGVDICFRAILNSGDEVIIPAPTYVCYSPLVELTGAKTVTIDTTDTQFIPDLDRIKAAITPQTKAIVLCSPSNPTGAVIPKDRLEGILELAKTHDFWIIADEIYAELADEKQFVSMASLPGAKDYTILFNGFSKAFAMTGWRLAYICAPADLIDRANKVHQYSALCAPIVSQYAAITALQKTKSEVKKMRESYVKRRHYFVNSMNEIGLETQMPEGAFYAFVSIRSTGMSSEEFAIGLLEKERVAVVPGTAFGPEGEGFVRCCYATDFDDLKEAATRITRFVQGRK